MWGGIGSICSLLCCYLSAYFPELFCTIPNRSHHNKMPILHLATFTLFVCQEGQHITRASSSLHQVMFLRLTSMAFEMPKNLNLPLFFFNILNQLKGSAFWSIIFHEIGMAKKFLFRKCLPLPISGSTFICHMWLLRKYHGQKIILQERKPIVYHTCTPCNTGKLIT